MLERWRERDVFHETIRRREGAPLYVFYEGPPTANGAPGLPPRAVARVQGHLPALQDHARLPGAPQGRLGLPRPAGRAGGGAAARHQLQARDRGLRHRRVQRASAASRCCATSRNGTPDRADRLLDRPRRRLRDARRTSTSSRSGGRCKQIWDKGLLYEGYKVVPYCPRCGTALSSHEVALGYQDVVDPSIYVRFPVRRRPAATRCWCGRRRPGRSCSNAAVAVDPEVTYVRARLGTRR